MKTPVNSCISEVDRIGRWKAIWCGEFQSLSVKWGGENKDDCKHLPSHTTHLPKYISIQSSGEQKFGPRSTKDVTTTDLQFNQVRWSVNYTEIICTSLLSCKLLSGWVKCDCLQLAVSYVGVSNT